MYLLLPLMNYWYGMVPVRYHGMVPGTMVWYEYIYIRGCCCCLFCVNCFSSSFFVCRPHFCHIFFELLFVLFSSTKNDSQKKADE